MRAAPLIVAILFASGSAAAAQESRHEQAVKQTRELLEQIYKTLSSINDRDAAEAARPELRKAALAWDELRKKVKELPPPERAEKDQIARKYKEELRKAAAQLQGQVRRVQSIPGTAAALMEISSVLKRPEE